MDDYADWNFNNIDYKGNQHYQYNENHLFSDFACILYGTFDDNTHWNKDKNNGVREYEPEKRSEMNPSF